MHEEVALRYSTFVEYINPVNATWGGGARVKMSEVQVTWKT